MSDKFAVYHPLINFTFFVGAIVFGMLLMHPGFLVCSLLLSVCYYLTIKGRKGWKFLVGLLPFLGVLSAVNPLFNTYGEHVLFRYWNGRPYTLEAFCYGAVLAAMMGSILVWFACCNEVMTSDKLLYLFGRLAPSITLILMMALRLIPSYKNKVNQMNGARRCIGKGSDTGTTKEKLEHSVLLLSALTSWALEGSVITADSMRSRGYGCGKRTMFSVYRFEKSDRLLLLFMLLLAGILSFCCLHGAAAAEYTPELALSSWQDPYVKIGIISYAIFLAIPSAVNIWEEIRWHSLKSKI